MACSILLSGREYARVILTFHVVLNWPVHLIYRDPKNRDYPQTNPGRLSRSHPDTFRGLFHLS
jgi:hypothetical protein